MQTFIIPWAPSESGYTSEQLQRDLPNPDYGLFSWPADSLGKARSGDNFYLVCREGDPFVVMRGFFLSDPEDGSVGLRPTFISWPSGDAPRFLIDTLDRETPGFSWRLYTSGDPLPDWAGKKLSALFNLFLENVGDNYFDGIQAERSRKPAANVDDAIGIAAEVYCDEPDPIDGRPAILAALRVAVQGNDETEVICGALRDVIGRAGWTGGRLRDRGFTEQVVDCLVTLHWEEGETPAQHFRRIYERGDKTAMFITLLDQEDRVARGGGIDSWPNGLR